MVNRGTFGYSPEENKSRSLDEVLQQDMGYIPGMALYDAERTINRIFSALSRAGFKIDTGRLLQDAFMVIDKRDRLVAAIKRMGAGDLLKQRTVQALCDFLAGDGVPVNELPAVWKQVIEVDNSMSNVWELVLGQYLGLHSVLPLYHDYRAALDELANLCHFVNRLIGEGRPNLLSFAPLEVLDCATFERAVKMVLDTDEDVYLRHTYRRNYVKPKTVEKLAGPGVGPGTNWHIAETHVSGYRSLSKHMYKYIKLDKGHKMLVLRFPQKMGSGAGTYVGSAFNYFFAYTLANHPGMTAWRKLFDQSADPSVILRRLMFEWYGVEKFALVDESGNADGVMLMKLRQLSASFNPGSGEFNGHLSRLTNADTVGGQLYREVVRFNEQYLAQGGVLPVVPESLIPVLPEDRVLASYGAHDVPAPVAVLESRVSTLLLQELLKAGLTLSYAGAGVWGFYVSEAVIAREGGRAGYLSGVRGKIERAVRRSIPGSWSALPFSVALVDQFAEWEEDNGYYA